MYITINITTNIIYNNIMYTTITIVYISINITINVFVYNFIISLEFEDSLQYAPIIETCHK